MSSVRENDYRSAGFSGALGFGRTPALLVIDMMMSYFDRASPMYAGVEAVAASNLRLIAAAQARKIPLFFTRQVHEQSADATVYARKVPALKLLNPGSALAELHPSLPADSGTVIVKRYPSAFYRTDLASRLLALKVDTLIITGLTTSGCVRATAMDTLLNDLTGVVVREAVGDRDARAHEANLFDIDAKLADVRSEADVLRWIDGR